MASIASPAAAQNAIAVEGGFSTDYRVRGLSWSDGKAAAQVHVSVPVGTSFDLGAQVTTLRNSPRHGDANVGVDLHAGYTGGSGLLRWYAMGVARLFPGSTGENTYVEGQAGANLAYGPAEIGVMTAFAPSQDAIGGNNFYIQLNAQAGIPGMPVTVFGHVGKTSGSVDDPLKAQRLRPAGAYTDWALGADYHLAPLVLSLTYSDTDIAQADLPAGPMADHTGARLVAGAMVRF
ncbi:TorF family putative porin [Aurantiacibacter xanthus]|nr:TorF family putative porin [Aurantiacibacter xanthus]